MKNKRMSWLGVILVIGGYITLFFIVGWKVALTLFLINWGNDIISTQQRKRRDEESAFSGFVFNKEVE
jgi:heme O synthase-like polyprenyltransferase